VKRDILERPFEAALIKCRRGAFGKQLSYVEGSEYVRRLNEAFDGEWSFDILEHHVYDAEVVVLGKLTAGPVVKTAFGGSGVTTNTQTGEVISLADDLKAAATDSLKKAASLLGVGLHLYGDQPSNGSAGATNSTPPTRTRRRPNSNGRSNGRGSAGSYEDAPVHHRDRLTQRQLAAIWSIGRALGVNTEEVRRRSTEIYGVGPEQLSKSDASAFISRMKEALPGNDDTGAFS
jgi:hypothetical protein